MNILKIDTSDNLVTKIELEKAGKTFRLEEKRKSPSDQNVLELIDKLAKRQGLSLPGINAIEIKKGPGSFTGLRVGTSIANALSFALGIPVNNKKAGEIEVPQY